MNNNYSKKTLILQNWYSCESFIYLILKLFGSGICSIRVLSGFEIAIYVSFKHIWSLINFFKVHYMMNLTDIKCYDNLSSFFRYFLIYNLKNEKFDICIKLICKVKEFSAVVSISSLFKAANWLEREIFDLFGIFFICHKDLRRILTDYGFIGFPLRKDFPLSGFIEVYYEDANKTIIYKNLELNQKLRLFDFQNNWNIIIFIFVVLCF